MVTAKGDTLLFIEKDEKEDRPFGKTNEDNPFEIALNYGEWYKHPIAIKNFRENIRKYFYTHHPVMETIFIWHGRFNMIAIYQNGSITSNL